MIEFFEVIFCIFAFVVLWTALNLIVMRLIGEL